MWVHAQKYKAHIKANISYKPHTNPIENHCKVHAKDIFYTKLIQSFNKNIKGIENRSKLNLTGIQKSYFINFVCVLYFHLLTLHTAGATFCIGFQWGLYEILAFI